MNAELPTPADIRSWISDPEQWPTDSYALDSLEPLETLARRETSLREIVPTWFWSGERGAALLSIGSGKGYFERRYWNDFSKVYVIDPARNTRLAFQYFPLSNVLFVGSRLFEVPYRFKLVPKHAWLGACIHYIFAEFHGWEFMYKLAMMVSDSVVIDAGVFDADTQLGRHLMAQWSHEETIDERRRSQFSYDHFLQAIRGLWSVEAECDSTWIGEGRRTVLLKRILPPVIQRRDLDLQEEVGRKPGRTIYSTSEGYYKETYNETLLLAHDTVLKAMGHHDLLKWTVYDGEVFAGFVMRDLGHEQPSEAFVSEQLFMMILNWALPLGLLPSDVARENIRMVDGRPVWIDIDLVGLRELDARGARWVVSNIYKQYRDVPSYARDALLDC